MIKEKSIVTCGLYLAAQKKRIALNKTNHGTSLNTKTISLMIVNAE